jgi:sugar phosphate isomerase/epimerase
MRLGGPLFDGTDSPDTWIVELKRLGYRAAFCPVDQTADEATVTAYRSVAAASDIVIAEVGAWSNPMSLDEDEAARSLEHCKGQLDLADRIGAQCCVNISGSMGTKWDGPDSENLTEATFDLIVETTRAIIDAAKPVRTYYTLETMPWMYPDSVESYSRLVTAVDRDRFAVHFDPVNLICSPQRYYVSSALIRDFTQKLGSKIRSCHAKDIILDSELTVHLAETRPGLGELDYVTYLTELHSLHSDLPLMLEHLPIAEEYDLAADHIRSTAKAEGIDL